MIKFLAIFGIVLFASSRKERRVDDKFTGLREKLQQVVQNKNKLGKNLQHIEDRITTLSLWCKENES